MLHRARVACGALALVTLGVMTFAQTAGAQTLEPKRVLTTGPAAGCDAPTAGQAVIARRDNVEARRLSAAGQEAALLGDQSAARDAFARAAALNPGDERVAYDLARAHEELADTTKAISEYCRYLTLSPSGREASDVRDRLVRLVPRAVQQRAEDVLVAFRLGLALFDDARYEASAKAFDDVIQLAPSSAEGYFNRGLARSALGRRTDALQDLDQYRAAAPTVDDRVEVGRAIEVLRRPVYRPSIAFARSLLAGFGQLYTARPVRGLVLLAAVAGSTGFAFTQKTTETQVAYVDPNGVPAPYTQRTTERPYFVPALAAAGVLTVVGSVEAVWFAKRSQRGASILVRRASNTPSPGARNISLSPWSSTQGAAGFRVRATF
ncbi:MAG: tetratricopeptide repeat protein [Gemmatimonadaceae bacterium]|nr:tetratricopeptide repeat protein [Gemmatimonadaceae bacterium]